MDFLFTEEQVLFRDSLRRFCRDFYSFGQRQAYAKEQPCSDRLHWDKLAELGVLAVPFDAESGGLGGGVVDVMIVMEEFGRALAVEPYLANIVLAGGVLKRIPDAQTRARLLKPLVTGAEMISLAYVEPGSRYDLRAIESTAVKDGKDYVLNGQKIIVLNGVNADRFIVSARTEVEPKGAAGVTLFIIDANHSGVHVQGFATVDGFAGANVTFTNVRVPSADVIGNLGGGLDLLEPCVDEAIIAIGAEAVGAMDYLNGATLEYAKTRKQFGVPIASFQVLQHRMVDMHIERELTLSILFKAAMLSTDGGKDAKIAASALKIQLAKACRFIGQQAVQLHGGMGIADETPVAHYFKRLSVISQQFGGADFFAERYAALSA